MNAGQLFQAGKLDQAIQALGAELRDNPADAQRRTFLFELLCFAGAYDRAEKHLDFLATGGKDAQLGALLYQGALHAERTRSELFREARIPRAPRHRSRRAFGNAQRPAVFLFRGRRSARRRAGWKSSPPDSTCGCLWSTSPPSRCSRPSGSATCCGRRPWSGPVPVSRARNWVKCCCPC